MEASVLDSETKACVGLGVQGYEVGLFRERPSQQLWQQEAPDTRLRPGPGVRVVGDLQPWGATVAEKGSQSLVGA